VNAQAIGSGNLAGRDMMREIMVSVIAGSEDYFNDAWGFRERTSHWFGQPRWQGYDAGDNGICYRWHILDPVYFRESLKVTIEHKGNHANSEDAWFVERPDFFSSVAYWYQIGKPKPFGYLPPYQERCVPWHTQHLVKTFRQAKVSGEGKVNVQAVGFFGGRPSLQWQNTEVNATLALPFTVAEDGRYAVRLVAFTSPECGSYDIQLDGKTIVSAVSFQTKDFDEIDFLLGTHNITQGEHELTFQALSSSSKLALELLKILKLPPEAIRETKTHNEAHFIRLGVGRAVYAYRLAYDELPSSLDALVQSGFMSSRYLTDENNFALKSRIEGEYFVVESTAPNGWKHRWLGLDARR